MSDVDEFLSELALIPDVEVSAVTRVQSTVSASVRHASIEATLICNAIDGPASYDKNGVPEFGSFLLVEDGYGDRIKGMDPSECVCYTLGWLVMRSFARGYAPEEPSPLPLDRYQSDGEADLPQLAHEITLRSGALVTIGIDRAHVQRSDLVLRIDAGSSGLRVRATLGRSMIWIPRLPVRLMAAALAGILDGLDARTDE